MEMDGIYSENGVIETLYNIINMANRGKMESWQTKTTWGRTVEKERELLGEETGARQNQLRTIK